MNTSIKNIKAKYAQLFSGSKIGQTVHNPTQSWLRVVVFATSVAFILCGVGVYVFFVEKKIDDTAVGVQNGMQNTFTKGHVEEIVKQYREHTSEFTSLRSLVPEIPQTGGRQVEIPVEIVEEVEVKEEGVEEGENERPELVP